MIDGVNTTYTLERSYGDKTLGVWRNGVIGSPGVASEGGWIETDPDAGVFDMRTPLRTGDRIRVFYADSGILTPVSGVILQAQVRTTRVIASLATAPVLQAQVAAPRVSGLLSDTQSVKALLRVVRVGATVKVCS